MLSTYRETAFDPTAAAPVVPDRRAEIAVLPAADPDRTATPVMPGQEAVRALLLLAAESAFDLRNGVANSVSVAQLQERSESLAQTLSALPDVIEGADYSLMLRRARQAVDILNEAIRRDILDRIDKNTGAGDLKATLREVRDVAVTAGTALAHLKVRGSGSR